MIESFGNKTARSIWEKDTAKDLPRPLHKRAKALMTIMHSTSTLDDLQVKGTPPGLKLHRLKGDRAGEWSMSIVPDTPWRITFRFKDGKFSGVKIENYH